MKIVCLADTHQRRVPLDLIPDGDFLVIAGDIMFTRPRDFSAQRAYLDHKFNPWLLSLRDKFRDILLIAGNHDSLFERDDFNPEILECTYLQDSGIDLHGVRFYGTPWQKWFNDWSFNAPRDDVDETFLREKFSRVGRPDVLITHGPPHGYGDKNLLGHHCGSKALLETIATNDIKLTIYGHIHDNELYRNHGIYSLNSSVLVNASALNDDYVMVNKPIVVTI